VAERGIYCLADDGVFEWFVAFAESLRAYSDLPLLVIPYSDRIKKLSRLRDRYEFAIQRDQDLPRLEAIGRRIWPSEPGAAPMFRRFAAFWGPFDRFLVLDSDIVMLTDPQRLLAAFERSRADVLCFDWNAEWAYEPGELFERFPDSRGVNAGALASSSGLFDIDELERRGDEAESLRDAFVRTGDQPFLNYCLDAAGHSVAALPEVDEEFGTSWGGWTLGRTADGRPQIDAPRRPGHGRVPPMLHWAGYSLKPRMRNKPFFLRYRLGEDAPRWKRYAYEARLAAMAAAQYARRARRRLGRRGRVRRSSRATTRSRSSSAGARSPRR
jgi:hypothetical protein